MGDTPAQSSNSQPQAQASPTYKPQDPVATYAASFPTHAVQYGGYEAGYGDQNPSLYDYMIASRYPNAPTSQNDLQGVHPIGGWLPYFRILGVVIKIFSKLGYMVLGGAGLIVAAIAMTTAVCSLTPLCDINFFGAGVSQEAVRAMLSPEKITATAEFVQQAIDKYQQMQRALN